MTVKLNHTIVRASEVTLDFLETDEAVDVQHFAFLVGEAEFDQIFARVKAKGLEWWADPHRTRKGESNPHDGGRGVYFLDPCGHVLEIITRPCGSGG